MKAFISFFGRQLHCCIFSRVQQYSGRAVGVGACGVWNLEGKVINIRTPSKIRKNSNMASLNDVPPVDIDPCGVFKYILIKLYEQSGGDDPHVLIVRGYKRCNYHSDIFDEVQEKLSPLDCECLGGGRMSHDPDSRKIHVYGYSQGYGKADHETTAKILKENFKDYTISISDEGY